MIHKEYVKMKSRWKKCRDAAAGEYEIHEATTAYLPKLPEESDVSYKMRLDMTPWFNASWRTIIGLRGMMFRRPPTITFPDSLSSLLENVDNEGTSIETYLQKMALEALIVGRVGELVDYPNLDSAVTMADAKGENARPYLVRYVAENILDWKYKTVNGSRKLVMVRLKESEDVRDDIEIEENEEIHKILELNENGEYSQKLVIAVKGNYQVRDKKEGEVSEKEVPDSLVVPKMNNKSLDYIPFQFIGVDSLDGTVEVPPLMDLVDLNVHHYRQSSAYERGCFISGLPTLAVYGNQDDKKVIYIGGATANNFSNPSARMEFVEVQSKFEALTQNLENKERQMAVIGARMLEKQNKGVESSDTLARKQSGEESILSDMSTTIGSGATNILRWFAEWAGAESSDVKVELTKEFLPFAMDSGMITALMAAHIQGGLSYNALYYNFEKAGLYPPDTSLDKESGLISESNPEPSFNDAENLGGQGG